MNPTPNANVQVYHLENGSYAIKTEGRVTIIRFAS